eukprot:GHVS01056782.1.p1 GENE.GHVS01056782.1~~GHVS01056782.1.p1  ORF type:complete len:755 (+),score=107.93 GHVS01056782.1:144-2408(+)
MGMSSFGAYGVHQRKWSSSGGGDLTCESTTTGSTSSCIHNNSSSSRNNKMLANIPQNSSKSGAQPTEKRYRRDSLAEDNSAQDGGVRQKRRKRRKAEQTEDNADDVPPIVAPPSFVCDVPSHSPPNSLGEADWLLIERALTLLRSRGIHGIYACHDSLPQPVSILPLRISETCMAGPEPPPPTHPGLVAANSPEEGRFFVCSSSSSTSSQLGRRIEIPRSSLRPVSDNVLRMLQTRLPVPLPSSAVSSPAISPSATPCLPRALLPLSPSPVAALPPSPSPMSSGLATAIDLMGAKPAVGSPVTSDERLAVSSSRSPSNTASRTIASYSSQLSPYVLIDDDYDDLPPILRHRLLPKKRAFTSSQPPPVRRTKPRLEIIGECEVDFNWSGSESTTPPVRRKATTPHARKCLYWNSNPNSHCTSASTSWRIQQADMDRVRFFLEGYEMPLDRHINEVQFQAILDDDQTTSGNRLSSDRFLDAADFLVDPRPPDITPPPPSTIQSRRIITPPQEVSLLASPSSSNSGAWLDEVAASSLHQPIKSPTPSYPTPPKQRPRPQLSCPIGPVPYALWKMWSPAAARVTPSPYPVPTPSLSAVVERCSVSIECSSPHPVPVGNNDELSTIAGLLASLAGPNLYPSSSSSFSRISSRPPIPPPPPPHEQPSKADRPPTTGSTAAGSKSDPLLAAPSSPLPCGSAPPQLLPSPQPLLPPLPPSSVGYAAATAHDDSESIPLIVCSDTTLSYAHSVAMVPRNIHLS